ncbi:hypothetical protein [Helicobacter sp. 16-1353]|uniref:hypothetical protein n=1 Tax=Helicobacter sp. 16-1353 TaxID=2004996 RepID=UPI000DD4486F|nr:hypothetical protein [Helicobacter sp. 16-1353]
MQRKAIDGGDALSLHTAGQAYTGANVASSALSSTANISDKSDNNIISQDNQKESIKPKNSKKVGFNLANNKPK